MRNSAGALMGAINCFQDITERKRAAAADITERVRAEHELRRSEQRLRLVIDTIPAMAWRISEEELSAGRSLGILGMRERVLVLGGDLAISGAPGKGTAVRVRIPHVTVSGTAPAD